MIYVKIPEIELSMCTDQRYTSMLLLDEISDNQLVSYSVSLFWKIMNVKKYNVSWLNLNW